MTTTDETVGQRLYPVPDLEDVELKLLAERLIMAGVDSRVVKRMRVADLITLAQKTADAFGAQPH
jgi:hypothetical protein